MASTIKEHICRSRRLPRSDEVLRGRAEFLTQDERDLVEAVILKGQPVKTVARMVNQPARTVRRRLHKITRRLASTRFLGALRAMPYLEPEDAYLATRWYCQDASQARLAQESGLTIHVLRRRLDQIAAQIAILDRQRRARRRAGYGAEVFSSPRNLKCTW